MTSISSLFLSFCRIGAFTFGGGYAMLPMLEREVVERRQWATQEELLNYFAIGQCTPGLIAVNTATFIGHKQRGILGGIVATLGVVTPSFVIILLLAMLFQSIAHLAWVQHAFAGIRVAVCALILHTVVRLIRSNVKNIPGIAICAAAFVLVACLGVSPVFVVLGAALFGIAAGVWGWMN